MTTAPARTGRILELDALRGIAAMGVVFWHYGAHFDAHPLSWLLFPFYNAGFLLVDFFFVLSGYVIARAYWRPSRQHQPARNIWARVARLYPLHVLMLLVTVALVATLPPGATDTDFNQPTNDLKHLALNLLLLNQVGLQDGWSFNIPAWSISTEFVTNVLFLAFISLSLRMRWVAMAVVALLGAVMVASSGHPYVQGLHAFGYLDVNLARCFLGFAAGVGVHWGLHRLQFERWLAASPAVSTVLGSVSLVALVGILVLSGRHPPMPHYLVSIASAMGCVAFVPFSPLLRRLLIQRPLTFLGDISYSTYLVHYPLQLALYSLATWLLPGLDYASPLVLGGYVACVIALSVVTHRRIELPWQSRLLGFASAPALPAR